MLKFILVTFSIVSLSFILCNVQEEKKFIQLNGSNLEFKLNEFNSEKKITFVPNFFESYPKEMDSPKLILELKKYNRFEQKKDFDFSLIILNKNLNPIKNTKIIFSTKDSSFFSYTDELGKAKFSFQIEEIHDFIQFKILTSNQDSIKINLPLSYKIFEDYYLIKNISEVVLDTSKENSSFEKSSDLVLNRFPKKSLATVAFEDTYPVHVDSDFNDYVSQFYFEEQILLEKVKSIDAKFYHVAKGSNYNHNFNMKFISKDFHKILDFDPVIELTSFNDKNKQLEKTFRKIDKSDLTNGIIIFPDSKKTISGKNTVNGTNFAIGNKTFLKILFSKPIPRNQIGFPPYDLYIKVSNNFDGNSNEFPKEIHLPNIYFDHLNTDLYIDSNQLPFAIIVPEIWSWQYEGKDITNERFSGYPDFNKFINSKGILYKNWYENKISEKVYPVPNLNPNLTAYIQGSDSGFDKLIVLVFVVLLILFVLYLRRKFVNA